MAMTPAELGKKKRQFFEDVRMHLPCPVNKNAKVSMSDKGFRDACSRATTPKWGGYSAGKKGKCRCDVCQERANIISGNHFTPPSGITIVEVTRKQVPSTMSRNKINAIKFLNYRKQQKSGDGYEQSINR